MLLFEFEVQRKWLCQKQLCLETFLQLSKFDIYVIDQTPDKRQRTMQDIYKEAKRKTKTETERMNERETNPSKSGVTCDPEMIVVIPDNSGLLRVFF